MPLDKDGFTQLIPVSEWIGYGDLVTIPTAGDKLYRVIKCNPTTYRLVDEDGKEWTIRHRGAKKAPAGSVFNDKPKVVRPFEDVREGHVVFITNADICRRAGCTSSDKWVCLKRMDGRRGKFARLNGAGDGRIWTLPLADVTITRAA